MSDVEVTMQLEGYGRVGSTRTDGEDRYAIEAEDGNYLPSATVNVEYNGQNYRLPLHPREGNFDAVPASGGMVEDFVWNISGPTPNAVPSAGSESENPVQYYGGFIPAVHFGIDPNLGGGSMLPPYIDPNMVPASSPIELTLIPEGPLIDGSQGGEALALGCALEWNEKRGHQRYALRAMRTDPGHTPLPIYDGGQHHGERYDGAACARRGPSKRCWRDAGRRGSVWAHDHFPVRAGTERDRQRIEVGAPGTVLYLLSE